MILYDRNNRNQLYSLSVHRRASGWGNVCNNVLNRESTAEDVEVDAICLFSSPQTTGKTSGNGWKAVVKATLTVGTGTPVTQWSPGMQRQERAKFVWGCPQESAGICLRRHYSSHWFLSHLINPGVWSLPWVPSHGNSADTPPAWALCKMEQRARASGASVGCMGTESRHRACPQESTRRSRQQSDPLSSPLPTTTSLC